MFPQSVCLLEGGKSWDINCFTLQQTSYNHYGVNLRPIYKTPELTMHIMPQGPRGWCQSKVSEEWLDGFLLWENTALLSRVFGHRKKRHFDSLCHMERKQRIEKVLIWQAIWRHQSSFVFSCVNPILPFPPSYSILWFRFGFEDLVERRYDLIWLGDQIRNSLGILRLQECEKFGCIENL